MKRGMGTLLVAGTLAFGAGCKKDEAKAPAATGAAGETAPAASAAPAKPSGLRDLTAAGLQVAAQAAGAAADAITQGKGLAEVAGEAAKAATKAIAPGLEKLAEAAAKIAVKVGEKGEKAAESLGQAAVKVGLDALAKMVGGAGTTTPAPVGPQAEPRLPDGYADHFPHPANAKARMVTAIPSGGYVVALEVKNQPAASVADAYRTGIEGKGWKVISSTDTGTTKTFLAQKAGKTATLSLRAGDEPNETHVSVTLSP